MRKSNGGLYKTPTEEERRKRKAKRREIRSSLLILDLKDGKTAKMTLGNADVKIATNLEATLILGDERKDSGARLLDPAMRVFGSIQYFVFSELC